MNDDVAPDEEMTLGARYVDMFAAPMKRALDEIRQADALVFKPGDIVALETKRVISAEDAGYIRDVFEARGLEVVIIGPDFKIARQKVPADD